MKKPTHKITYNHHKFEAPDDCQNALHPCQECGKFELDHYWKCTCGAVGNGVTGHGDINCQLIVNKIMTNEETPILIGLLITFISMFIGIGYWWGSSNETKIIEKSVYTEREKCNSLGGYFEARDVDLGIMGNKEFLIDCRIPAKSIEI